MIEPQQQGREGATSPALRILHAGCGKRPLPEDMVGIETRLDIDSRCHPDVVAPLTDMGDIGPFDIAYSSHVLEHLLPSQVPVALSEFRRVLVPGGTLIIVVPDLEDARPTTDVLFVSGDTPICGLDLFYGHHEMTADNPFMSHRCGFTAELLNEVLVQAGFSNVQTKRLEWYTLMATANA